MWSLNQHYTNCCDATRRLWAAWYYARSHACMPMIVSAAGMHGMRSWRQIILFFGPFYFRPIQPTTDTYMTQIRRPYRFIYTILKKKVTANLGAEPDSSRIVLRSNQSDRRTSLSRIVEGLPAIGLLEDPIQWLQLDLGYDPTARYG
jgi:hypothetical protein